MTPNHSSNTALRVAAAIAAMPRKAFEAQISALHAGVAATEPLPMNVLETMLHGLELQGPERVLCIGHAVGYPAALLSHLAREVHLLEIDEALVEPEASALAKLGRTNVNVKHASGVRGWHAAAPYEGILVTAAAPELPPAFIGQLATGYRIVIPLGDQSGQLIELLEKRVDGLVSRTLGRCCLPLFPSLKQTPSVFPWTPHDGR